LQRSNHLFLFVFFSLIFIRCTVLYLLNQRHLFTAFDFTSHVVSVAKAEKKSMFRNEVTSPNGVQSDEKKFLENAMFYQQLNEDIFEYLYARFL